MTENKYLSEIKKEFSSKNPNAIRYRDFTYFVKARINMAVEKYYEELDVAAHQYTFEHPYLQYKFYRDLILKDLKGKKK